MDKPQTPTLAQILKAAAVLADADTDTLTLRTGILRSRLARLLNGSAAPNADETARILKAAGCEGSLLTKHVLTSGSHGVLAALLRPYRFCSPAACIPVAACRLTIDKISIVFNPVDDERLIETAQQYGAKALPNLYRSAFAGHGVRVDHEPTEPRIGRSSRIEFNPDRALGKVEPDRAAGRFVSAVTRLFKPDEAKVTQIDVAVDLPISIRDVQGIVERRRKLHFYIGPEGVETIYCGSQGSDCQIVVYDKHQERCDRGQAASSAQPRTRFEACIRRPGLSLLELPALANPFKGLRLFRLRSDGLPLTQRLLVEYARLVGLPAVKAELDRDGFTALCRDLELSAAAPIVPHPRDVYDAKWFRVSRSLLAALRLGART